MRLALICSSLLVLTLVGCSSGDDASTVSVRAGDTTCRVSDGEVPAGDVTFDVRNGGSVVDEVYLYGPGDRVMGEVENVGPGARGSFSVHVGGGRYQVACKPNQQGNGIRTPFVVTGKADPSLTAPTDPAVARDLSVFNVKLDVDDTTFAPGLSELTVAVGQTVRFRIHNGSASQAHGFAVRCGAGAPLGDTGAIPPGRTAKLDVKFDAAATCTASDSVSGQADGRSGTFKVVR